MTIDILNHDRLHRKKSGRRGRGVVNSSQLIPVRSALLLALSIAILMVPFAPAQAETPIACGRMYSGNLGPASTRCPAIQSSVTPRRSKPSTSQGSIPAPSGATVAGGSSPTDPTGSTRFPAPRRIPSIRTPPSFRVPTSPTIPPTERSERATSYGRRSTASGQESSPLVESFESPSPTGGSTIEAIP